MVKSFIDYLVEAIGDGPRIPHPEDAILHGSDAAKEAALALEEILNQPQMATIKWDGGIALYFGRNPQGSFFMTDKYMPSKGVYPTSPQGWREYDANRGANRNDLYEKIETIWSGLEENVGNTTGIFKGDLMMVDPNGLQPSGDNFVFSPTTVTYTVPVNSYLGKLMTNKVALIVVHEYADRPWDGSSGMANRGNVAVIPPNVNMQFDVPNKSSLSSLVKSAMAEIVTNSAASDKFLSGLDKVARGLLGQYLNQLRTQQTNKNIDQWLSTNANKKQYNNLIGTSETPGYIIKNHDGLSALFAIWNTMFKVKVAFVTAFESQVSGFKQETSAGPGGEGIVFPTSRGLIKLINPNFGIAHFSKER